jgi:ubiquinone/menaquinone biosynthesis C-methylase UbiE
MDTDRLTDLLVALHEGLPRLGPGNAESTLRALYLCEDLPAAPDVLDIGCGVGVQTLVLASAIDGRIIATDLFGQFLAELNRAAAALGLEGRIQTRQADMHDLPFADGSFDLIWSEGAAYVMGFDQALSGWRRLGRPGGYLVVSELSWFRPDPPSEIKEFWDLNYPAMRGVDANLAAARALGWMPVANFHLPAEAWTRDYYGPLRGRLPDFREVHAGDPDAQAVADMTEQEMDIMDRYSDVCGYEFYVLRRTESSQGQGITSH